MIQPDDPGARPTLSPPAGWRSARRPEPSARRGSYWWVWGCAAVAVLVVAAANGFILWQFHNAALDDARMDAGATAGLYAETADRTFAGVDAALSGIIAALAPVIDGDGALYGDTGLAVAGRAALAARLTSLPELAGVAIVGSRGELLAITRGFPENRGNVAGRDYFIALRADPGLQKFVGRPGQNGDDRSIFLARRIDGSDHAFAGLVVAAIRAPYLEDFFKRTRLADGSVVALWRDDGALLARYPAADDAPAAIAARRPLHDYALFATVAMNDAAALARWHREAPVIVGAAVAAAIVIGLIAALFRRHLITRGQVMAARSEIGIETNARIALERAIARAEAAIREHERAEAALRASEQRFRDIAEIAGDLIWESNAEHRFTLFAGGSSSEIHSRMGLNVDTALGRTRWQLAGADPADDPLWREHKALLDAHRPFRQFRYSMTTEAGDVLHFAVNGKPRFDPDGRFVGYRGIATSETAVVEARSRAERAESMLRDAVESISEGFVIYDEEDRLFLCNEAFRNLYPEMRDILVPGIAFEDVLRNGLKRRLYADALGRESKWLESRLESHNNPPGPIEAKHTTGRWLLISERRMQSGGIAGLRVDISALKSVEAALIESEERLNRAERLAKMGSDTYEIATNRVAWSDETYRIFGVNRGEFLPTMTSMTMLIHPDDRPIITKSRALVDKGVCPQPFEFRIMRPDNTVRYVYRDCELVRDEAGRPVLVAGTIHDITDLRASQERQRELERQLRHSQKLKALGTLAGGIAHDLNNTLVPILALSKHVAERMPAGSLDREDLETIVFGSERARDLVRQVLLLSRKQVMAKEEVDLGDVVRKSLQMMRVTVPENVSLVENIGEVPALHGDAGQLQQVVVNLVTNAIQAIGSELGTVTVTIAPTAADQWAPASEPRALAVALIVADTGQGMDAATLDRIFEPFYTTKGVGVGTGLGLSVVHGIVTDHGGRIEVDSELHKGTQIRVILPTTEVAAAAVRPVSPAPEQGSARSVLTA